MLRHGKLEAGEATQLDNLDHLLKDLREFDQINHDKNHLHLNLQICF